MKNLIVTITLPLTFLVVSLCGQRAVAENWQAWRGPRGDGTSSEKDLPSKWNGKTGENIATAEGRGFEGNCASSWVTYFKKRRVMEWQREKTLEKLREEGAVKMPGELAPPQAPRS